MDTQKQLVELQKAMKEATSWRLFERYQAVYLYLSGYTMQEIGHIIGRSRESISSYIHIYETTGIKGLSLKHSTGKPRVLRSGQEAQLKHVITTQTPNDVSISEKENWTLALMIAYVEREWGYTFTIRGMSLLLKRIGILYDDKNYVLKKEK